MKLEVEDSGGDPSQAVLLAKRFASDPGVLGILGPTRTGEMVAVARILPVLKIPVMSVGSTGDWPAAEGKFNDWTFRSTRVDSYLVGPLLQVARDKFAVRSLGIVYTANDDWSVSVLKIYEKEAQRLNLKIVAKESQMTGDTDRSAQLTKIAAQKPDALVINTLASDAPSIASQARQMGITARFLGTAGFTNPTTWKLAAPGTLDGALVADNFFAGSTRPAVKIFVDAYRDQFKSPPPAYSAYAYDGLMLMADAIRRANADGRASRGSVRTALASTSNFDGVLGSLTYHGSGDAEKEPIILIISRGSYERIAGGGL
jgi:branched-chain amino acid transport system substrate-binding protein